MHTILHFNQTLFPLVQASGNWSYLLFFLIIFAETGLVVFPYLPGESLIFFTSSIAAVDANTLDIYKLTAVFFFAALLGDTVNYTIGRHLERLTIFKRYIPVSKLLTAQRFFKRHGGKTVVFGRFVPFIRTFIPLISGTVHMKFSRFSLYNLLGVSLWVGVAVITGYFFGRIPIVQQHFSLIFIGIALLAIIPSAIFGLIKFLRRKKETQI